VKPELVANTCRILLIVLFSTFGIAGASAQDLNTELTPPSLQPPPVPDRSTLPVIQEEELLPPKGTGIAKPPLAWRAGVIKKDKFISNTFAMPPAAPPMSQRFFPEQKADAKRVYLNSKDDAFFALLSTCPKKGLQVVFIDSIHGKVLASTNTATISFSINAAPGNRSTIEATVERGDKQMLFPLLDDLLLSTGASMTSGSVF